MQTAEEILKNEISKILAGSRSSIKDIKLSSDLALAVLKNACKIYAAEAIKADRINVAEHAVTMYSHTQGYMNDIYIVDKDSIINAPNIELK